MKQAASLKELKKQAELLEKSLKEVYVKTGLIAHESNKLDDVSLFTELEPLAKKHSDEILAFQLGIEKLKEVDKRFIDVQTEQKLLQQRIVKIDKSYKQLYRESGVKAFEIFSEGTIQDQRIRNIFKFALDKYADLENMETEKDRLKIDLKEKKFIQKITDNTRILFLDTQIKGKSSEILEALEQAGRGLCNERLIDLFMNNELTQLTGPFSRDRLEMDKMEARIAEIEHEKDELTGEASHLGGQIPAAGTIKALVKKQQKERESLDEVCTEIGRLIFDEKKYSLSRAGDFKSLIDRGTSLRDEKVIINRKIAAIEAENEKEKILKNRERLEKRIEQLKAEIDERNQIIDSVKQEIVAVEVLINEKDKIIAEAE